MANAQIKVDTLGNTQAKELYDGFVISKRIITNVKDKSEKMSFHHVIIKAGWDHVILNEGNDEIIYFLSGKATISWKGNEVDVSEGSCVYVPSGCEYRYQAREDATMVCAFSPPAE